MRFIWIFIILPTFLFAQESAWQSITISDGLSQGMVFDMLQDRDGFLWIATKDGLNRYDGYNFKVFTNDPYNGNSISGNTCTSLLEDNKGRIWIGTEKDGLNIFDKQTQRFYHANIIDAALKNAGNYSINHLRIDESGTIWIFTFDAKKTFRIRQLDALPPNTDLSQLIEGVKNEELSYIPFRLDKHSIPFPYAKVLFGTKYPVFFDGEFLTNAPFSQYLCDNQNRIWTIGVSKLYCKKDTLFKVIEFPDGGQNSVLNQFEDGTLAIANKEYLWLIQPEELLKRDKLTPENAFTKIPPNCSLFTKDNVGNIWAGTSGYGLLRFNPQVKQFKAFLPNYSPSLLFKDMEGRIYFHANYLPSFHFYKVNIASNTAEPLLPKLTGRAWAHEAILQDRNHQFWILINFRNEEKRALAKFTKDWQLINQFILPSSYIPLDLNTTMLEDNSGNIWIGLINGNLLNFNPQTEQFSIFDYQSLLPQSGAFVQTSALYLDSPNTLWIGTKKGLIKAENISTNPIFSIYKNSNTNRQSLSNDFVSGVINDPILPQKYLWVSTKGGGLERLDKQTGKFEHFIEKQGLPNKVVYGVLVGDDNNIWVSTNRGIARLNPKTLIFTSFNKSDGLQDDEFNTYSYFKSPTSELLFGGVKGFNIFKPSQIGRKTTLPIIQLLSLKINNNPVEVGDKTGLLEKAIEYLPSIELAHYQNQLSLEFGMMDFTNPIKNRYQYQLEGIDNTWVDAGTTRFANYAQLPDGNYTFRVMGSTDGEVWSKPIELQIRINPPFYRTWWAYLIYILTAAYLAYRWNQGQLNRVRLQQQLLYKDKEAERLAELDAIKTSFFANISHEFRTPLTLILGPMEQIVQEYATDNRFPIIQRNAQRLLTLINQLLDISKLEAGQMQPELTHLEVVRYFRTLLSSFTSLAQSRQVEFVVIQNQHEVWGYLDTDKTEKIITNLLSNAFKFTDRGGMVTVEVSYLSANQQVEVKVTDKGIGIRPEKLAMIFNRFYQVESDQRRSYEGTGIGLALVKELVEVMKGSIRVESREGEGTTFWVRLPINEQTWLNYPKVVEKDWNTPKPLLEQSSAEPATQVELSASENVLLLIDDNADIRAYVRQIFETDYRIIEAQDGEEGLSQAMVHVPNIIISDLMMPRMDGFEFCRRLKSNEKTSHIPVIMLTAKANVESRIEGFELGADDYLVKPFNTAEIKARVKNLVEKQEKLRQYFNGKTIELKPSEVRVNSMDEVFLNKIKAVMEKQLSNSAFNVLEFAEAMNMSKSQLNRKLNALTNQSSNELLREFRLQRAAELLSQQAGTVSEIAYQVGFEHLSYFAKSFQERYGKLPSEFP